jgi:hypothetical protein
MAHNGSGTINFGGFPGSPTTSLFVTAPDIGAYSLLNAWICPLGGTSDHSEDEHNIERIRLYASNIIDQSGFTITAYGYSDIPQSLVSNGNNNSLIYGQWNVAWGYN